MEYNNWHRFLLEWQKEHHDVHVFQKNIFIYLCSLVGLTSLVLFGGVHLWTGQYGLGAFELSCAGFTLINILVLRVTSDVERASAVILLLMSGILGTLLLTGGIQNTGIFWFFTFPALAFFLKGTREGTGWIAGVYLFILSVLLLHWLQVLPVLPYTFLQIRQFLASLLAVTFIVFFYQKVNENNARLIMQQNRTLEERNHALQTEITEREGIENALRESETRFHKVIEHHVDAILVVDHQNVVRFVNPAATALFGLQQEALIGKMFGIPVIVGEATEFEIPRRDGSSSIVEIRTVEIEWENEPAYLESLRDITEHKQAQEALRESQEQVRALFQREQERRQLSDTLRDVAKIVSRTLDQHAVIHTILTQLESVVAYHRVTALLLTDDGNLTVVAGRDRTGRDEEHTVFPVQQYPLNAKILAQKQALLVPDVSQDPRWKSTRATAGIVSFIGAPLLVQEQPIGILTVGRRSAPQYNEDDARTVFAFASQVAIAIHNARLYEKTQEHNRRLELLHQISLAINSTLDLPSLLTAACQKLVENFHVDHSGILLFDDAYTAGEVMAEFPPKNAQGIRIPLEGYTLTQEMIKTARPYAVYDAQQDPAMEKVWGIMRRLSIRSLLIVPLIIQGQVIGSFSLDMTSRQRHFTASEQELTQTIASQLATAIDNARLLEKERTRIEQELETARQIQLSLLPASVPNIRGLEISGYSRPARLVGGDFYHYAVFSPQHLGIAVGDISGKGMQAALMMAMSVGLFISEVRSNLMPGPLLSYLNTQLYPHTRRSKKNTALGYLLLTSDQDAPQTCWHIQAANAGLIAPLVRRRDGTIEWLNATGLPLGMIPEIEYAEVSVTLMTHDIIVLCSDGLVETVNSRGELYGFDRLAGCIAAAPCQSAQMVQDYLLNDIHAFAGISEAHDDATLVIVMVRETSG